MWGLQEEEEEREGDTHMQTSLPCGDMDEPPASKRAKPTPLPSAPLSDTHQRVHKSTGIRQTTPLQPQTPSSPTHSSTTTTSFTSSGSPTDSSPAATHPRQRYRKSTGGIKPTTPLKARSAPAAAAAAVIALTRTLGCPARKSTGGQRPTTRLVPLPSASAVHTAADLVHDPALLYAVFGTPSSSDDDDDDEQQQRGGGGELAARPTHATIPAAFEKVLGECGEALQVAILSVAQQVSAHHVAGSAAPLVEEGATSAGHGGHLPMHLSHSGLTHLAPNAVAWTEGDTAPGDDDELMGGAQADGEAVGELAAFVVDEAEGADAATPATVMAALGDGKQFQRWNFMSDALLAAKFTLSWRGGSVVCDHMDANLRRRQLGRTLDTMPGGTRFQGRLILTFPETPRQTGQRRARVWVEAAATAPTPAAATSAAGGAEVELRGVAAEVAATAVVGEKDAALGAFVGDTAEGMDAATRETVMAALGEGKQFQRWNFMSDVLLAAKVKLSWRESDGVVCDDNMDAKWRRRQLARNLNTMPSVTRFQGRLILTFPGKDQRRARVWVEAVATAPSAAPLVEEAMEAVATAPSAAPLVEEAMEAVATAPSAALTAPWGDALMGEAEAAAEAAAAVVSRAEEERGRELVAWPSHATLPTVFGKVLGECGQALQAALLNVQASAGAGREAKRPRSDHHVAPCTQREETETEAEEEEETASQRRTNVRWSREEETAFVRLVEMQGQGNWAKVLSEGHATGALHQCRSSVDLKDKWRNLQKKLLAAATETSIWAALAAIPIAPAAAAAAAAAPRPVHLRLRLPETRAEEAEQGGGSGAPSVATAAPRRAVQQARKSTGNGTKPKPAPPTPAAAAAQGKLPG
jgi:hypothetical protein